MMGQLGDIVFEMLKEPHSLSGSKRYTYADHQVIRGLTKLQFTGHEPHEYMLAVRFHVSFCDVQAELDALEAQALKRGSDGYLQPLPFILGSGEVLGEYVITGIDRTFERMYPDGELMEVTAQVSIREFV